jgi:hypothetical protein
MTDSQQQGWRNIASAEDIAFTRWFTEIEVFSHRCERFADECHLDDAVHQIARNWLRAAFQEGFEAGRKSNPHISSPRATGGSDDSSHHRL